jgi:hypothetical protein
VYYNLRSESRDHILVEFEGLLRGLREFVALDEQLQVLPLVLDEFADHTRTGVLYRVVRHVQDLQTLILYVAFAVGCLLDLEDERDGLFRCSFLSLFVSFNHLVSGLFFELMLLILLLAERNLSNRVE